MSKRHDAAKTSSSYPHGGGRFSRLGSVRPERWVAKLLPGGIRERLFLLIALAAVPVLILQGSIYYQRHAARRAQALQTEVEVAQGIAATFSAYLDGLHRQLDAIGQAILALSPYASAEVQRLLDDAVAKHPSVRSMNWVSPEGRILVSNLANGVGRDLSVRPYFQQIQAGASWAVGDMTAQGAILDTPTVAMGAAVRDGGRLLGVVVASIEPTRLGEITFPHERHAGGWYAIFDSQGQLVYRNPSAPLTWEDRVDSRQTDPLLQGALEGRTTRGVTTSPVAKRRVVAARVPIPGTGWVAGAARAEEIALGPVRRALLQDALLGLLVASLALLLASLVARTIAEPLRRLEYDAHAMGAGVIEPPGERQAPIEVSRLRDSVSAMAAGLIERADALRKSEERYRTLFTNMSEGFALGEAVFQEDGTACDFHFLEINDAFEQQTDLTREILGRPMTEVLPNLERHWIDTYCGVARTGESVRFVEYNKDTGRHYDVFCYSPATNRFAILFRDVTERVQSERALREANERLQQQTEELQVQAEELQAQAEELRITNDSLEGREREYRTLAENTPEVIARFDRRLRHTYINEYGARVYGIPQREVLGKTNADLGMPADKIAFWNEHFAQVFATGRQQTVEFEFDSPAFGHQYFSSLFVPELDLRGEVVSILAITRDVTSARLAEQMLRREKALSESTIASLPGIFYLFDASGKYLKWNKNLEQVTGYGPDEMAGMHPLDFFTGEDKQLIERKIQEVFTEGQASAEAELVAKDGRRIPYLFTGLRTTLNGVDCVIGMGLDISERKQAEEALRASEGRQRRLIENLKGSHFVYVHDTNGVFQHLSETITGILGYTPEEFMAHYGTYLTDHPANQAVHRYTELSIQGIRQPPYEVNIRHKDGSTRWLEVQEVPVFDDEGKVVAVEGVAQDITERKRAEEALRESEQWFRTLANTTPQLVWTADPDGRVDYYNERYKEYQGIEPTGDGSFHWAPVLHPDDVAPTVAAWEHAVRTGEPYQIEHRVQRADGSYHWHLSRGLPVRDNEGRIVKWFGTATDIDGLKQAEEALRESEERFRTLADNMSQSAWMADKTGWIFWYNKRWYEYTGTTFDEMEGWGWRKIHHPDHVERVVEKIRYCFETGTVWEDTFPLRGADGRYRWFLSRAIPIRDEWGQVVRWFGTNTDVTEQRHAEESLRELTRTLESKVSQRTAELEHRARQLQKLTLELSEAEDRERRRLADVLHDDLQQQLAAVKFHLGRLSGRAHGDIALQRTVTLLDTMLATAIETSRSLSHELSPATLYHSDLGETLEWLANQIRAKHGLDVRVYTDGPISLESDALKAFLYKAAQEMLFNVVKHARVGEARVRVRRVGRCLCLVVSDRGRGFNPQDLRAAAGFGLFSICERVQLLGGRMRIKSAPGKGSTFFIAVPDGPKEIIGVDPRAYPASTTPGDQGGKEGGRGRPPLRVLVADDHEIVRQGLAALLREQGDIEFVGEAANGREAVDLASRLKPDVVIMDVAMPLMNGDEATRQTKMHLPGTRVVALSMYAEDGMVEKMRRAGADCYILKTAPADQLLAAVRGNRACA